MKYKKFKSYREAIKFIKNNSLSVFQLHKGYDVNDDKIVWFVKL